MLLVIENHTDSLAEIKTRTIDMIDSFTLPERWVSTYPKTMKKR